MGAEMVFQMVNTYEVLFATDGENGVDRHFTTFPVSIFPTKYT